MYPPYNWGYPPYPQQFMIRPDMSLTEFRNMRKAMKELAKEEEEEEKDKAEKKKSKEKPKGRTLSVFEVFLLMTLLSPIVGIGQLKLLQYVATNIQQALQ